MPALNEKRLIHLWPVCLLIPWSRQLGDAERATPVLDGELHPLIHRTGPFPGHPPSYLSTMSPDSSVNDVPLSHLPLDDSQISAKLRE